MELALSRTQKSSLNASNQGRVARGNALHYMSAQWPKLSRYVEDGSYPIDNNPAENSIRSFVVGLRISRNVTGGFVRA